MPINLKAERLTIACSSCGETNYILQCETKWGLIDLKMEAQKQANPCTGLTCILRAIVAPANISIRT